MALIRLFSSLLFFWLYLGVAWVQPSEVLASLEEAAARYGSTHIAIAETLDLEDVYAQLWQDDESVSYRALIGGKLRESQPDSKGLQTFVASVAPTQNPRQCLPLLLVQHWNFQIEGKLHGSFRVDFIRGPPDFA